MIQSITPIYEKEFSFKKMFVSFFYSFWRYNSSLKETSGVPIVAQQVKNLTWCPWGCQFDPWSRSVGLGSGIVMSYGVGCGCGSDLMLLWHRLAAVALIRPLALGTSTCRRCSYKEKKRSSCHGAMETNLTRNHEVVSLIPGLAQWIKDLALPWAGGGGCRLQMRLGSGVAVALA